MSAGGPTDLGVSPGLLGRHVARRAHDLPGVRLALVHLQPLGQAEVGDLGDAVGGEEDIGRLEVAMDDAGPVGRVHRHDQRDHPLGRLLAAAATVPRSRSARLPPSSSSSAT